MARSAAKVFQSYGARPDFRQLAVVFSCPVHPEFTTFAPKAHQMRAALPAIPFVASLTCILTGSLLAAPFVNLDFEQATVIPTSPPHFIDAAAAFPG